ncbi:prolyl oligopeptidase family serine peptidase [Actinomadura sp. 7K507]|uniref:alpha/beta hydrolase family protein n=1 Tax=Actinomadura sp. 7K507 TaxID=2530365 RepID=UPI00104BF9C6|nr:prolyl oligopeptidase family serine peptidase [Actinomadura sp. 7K507]TDC82568.1 hypothetical protein E1285_30455 [Actinomadura sp. 7K507]
MSQRGGDRAAFIQTWAEQGRQAAAHGAEARAADRRAAALSAYLRAYNYLRAAEFFVPASDLEERRKLYEESVAQFDAALPFMPHPVEKIAIPYAGEITLPGYVFTVADDGRPRPTVILCGGVDGYGEEMYLLGGVPEALARGLNVIVFHGPGQRGLQMYHPELAFRPDAEVPLGAVVDYAAGRPDADPDRIALYGMSFGGYLAPRAAASDRRIRALVANAPQRNLLGIVLGAAERERDGLMEQVGETGWAGQAMLENYLLWSSGAATLEEFAAKAEHFTLEGLEPEIACPTLSLAAEGEIGAAMEQARQFHEALRVPKRFVTLTAAEGADAHCGIGNLPYTSALIYDWLAEQLA